MRGFSLSSMFELPEYMTSSLKNQAYKLKKTTKPYFTDVKMSWSIR